MLLIALRCFRLLVQYLALCGVGGLVLGCRQFISACLLVSRFVTFDRREDERRAGAVFARVCSLRRLEGNHFDLVAGRLAPQKLPHHY